MVGVLPSTARLIAPLARRRYARVAKNLAVAMPHLDEATREGILRGAIDHFAQFPADLLLCLSQRWRPVRQRFKTLCEPPAHDQLARLRTSGAIVVGAHLGNWEVGAAALRHWGVPLVAVAHSSRSLHRRWALRRMRSALGVESLYAEHHAKEMSDALRNKKCLGLLIDLKRLAYRTPVHFFGQPVFAPAGPAVLSLRTGAPVFLGACLRQEKGPRFRFELQELTFDSSKNGRRKEDIQSRTQTMFDALESLIRRYPSQWVWFHNRWTPARR